MTHFVKVTKSSQNLPITSLKKLIFVANNLFEFFSEVLELPDLSYFHGDKKTDDKSGFGDKSEDVLYLIDSA